LEDVLVPVIVEHGLEDDFHLVERHGRLDLLQSIVG
jgi:hypothetical protein